MTSTFTINHSLYSGKLTLSVVNLTQTELATEEDKANLKEDLATLQEDRIALQARIAELEQALASTVKK